MAAAVIQSEMEEEHAPPRNGLKGGKAVELNNGEEKETSSAGSVEDTHRTPYLNNSNHSNEDVQELANGTSPSHYQGKVSRLEAQNLSLQDQLAKKDKTIQELNQKANNLMTLKATIATNFQAKQSEVENQLEQLRQLSGEVEDERRAKMQHQEASDRSQRNLQLFEEHDITVAGHLQMREKLQSYESKQHTSTHDISANEYDSKSNNDNNHFRTMYQEIVQDRDIMTRNVNTFKSTVVKTLTEIRKIVETKGTESSERYKELEQSNKQLENDWKALNREYKRIQREKSNVERDSKGKDTQLKQYRQRLNEQETHMTRHKKALNKQKSDFENDMERLNEQKAELKQRYDSLEKAVNNERLKWREEREQRTNFKEENARKISNAKKDIGRQLEKEQEFRINLEHKLQTSDDSLKKKKTTIAKLNTKIKTLETQLEIEDKKCQECVNEQRVLKRRSDEATVAEQSANAQLLTYEAELRDVTTNCERIKDQNQSLHEAMRKKDARLKGLQDRENEITKNLKEAESKKRQAQKTLEKVKRLEQKVKHTNDHKGSRLGTNSKKQTFMKKNDPFYEYRNILPFHWFTLVLAFLLFVMFCKANL